MNEYLTTVVATEHRRELLAEARSNRLARIARPGRRTWWQQVAAFAAGTARTDRSEQGRAAARRGAAHRFAH